MQDSNLGSQSLSLAANALLKFAICINANYTLNL